MNDLEQRIGGFIYAKLPPLPAHSKIAMVKYLPWVILLLCVFGFVAWLSALKYLLVFMGFLQASGGFGTAIALLLSAVLAPLQMAMAGAGSFMMFDGKLLGWRMVFYSTLISVALNVLDLRIIGLAINLVCVYLLFQIREYYR